MGGHDCFCWFSWLHFHSCMIRVFFNCSLHFGLVWSILQYEGFFCSRLGAIVERSEVNSHIGFVGGDGT